ncbi:hypothetical protein CSUI_000626 [Cystoisospora suis]|uniref:Uncharacterized protein n=1 Tax=Cystoisospora suis TaxID=483139 RepID=A0A2C6LER6_9APIC|nr:hypothetical protein CSUI_000626 [Cystoisospora suis]
MLAFSAFPVLWQKSPNCPCDHVEKSMYSFGEDLLSGGLRNELLHISPLCLFLILGPPAPCFQTLQPNTLFLTYSTPRLRRLSLSLSLFVDRLYMYTKRTGYLSPFSGRLACLPPMWKYNDSQLFISRSLCAQCERLLLPSASDPPVLFPLDEMRSCEGDAAVAAAKEQ